MSSVSTVPAQEAALAGALAGGDVAAVIMEPSGAAWATVPLPAGFLAAARRLATRHGALLVFDEVVTGFRWSPGGVQEVARLGRVHQRPQGGRVLEGQAGTLGQHRGGHVRRVAEQYEAARPDRKAEPAR